MEDNMKRCLALTAVLALLMLFAGCALPTGKDEVIPDTTSRIGEAENTVASDQNTSDKTTGSESDSKENGIDVSENALMTPVTLYYQDVDGYLIPMTRWVDKQPGIARAALNGLTDSAITREELQYYGVYPILPVDTEVLGINIKDGIATVDFNGRLMEYGNEDIEKSIVASVVYTLTEFSTISSVKLQVNGKALDTMKYGTKVSGLLSRSNVPINSTLDKGSKKADIFYFKRSNEGFTFLLPVSVKIKDSEEITPNLLVKQLLLEKTDTKLISEMPAGAELLNCTNNSGVLLVDFDEKFLDYGGNAREEGLLKQLVYTVRQSGGISKVKININGEAAQLPEGTYISSGIAIPRTINDIIDR